LKRTRDIGAVILAAGKGGRMGRPKLLLEIGGKSFLAHLIQVLGEVGISEIVCVVGGQFASWARRHFPRVTVVQNRNPAAGMFTSVKIGVKQLMGLKGVLIVPVDHPYVAKSTYRKLVRTFVENPDAIVKPTCRDRSGHPVLIPRKLFDHIRRAGRETTLMELIGKSKLEQLLVPSNDPGILKNMNTPADMRRGRCRCARGGGSA
jgi:molybdenum cofactor cytidylyltransferase